MTYEQFLESLSNLTDIPPREVNRIFSLLGQTLYSIPYGEKLRLPFGTFEPKLLKPKVIKRIDGVVFYGPVQYTVAFSPSDDLILEVPDPESIARGTFNAKGMFIAALGRRRMQLPKMTTYPLLTSPDFEDESDLDSESESYLEDQSPESEDPQ